jgi:hypothetical protein
MVLLVRPSSSFLHIYYLDLSDKFFKSTYSHFFSTFLIFCMLLCRYTLFNHDVKAIIPTSTASS